MAEPAAAASGRPPRVVVATAVVVAVVVGMVAVYATRTDPRSGGTVGGAEATSTNPAAFVLPRLRGSGTVRLTDFRGRPLLVNFFASWCTACEGEAPGFLRVDAELRGAVRFLAVDAEETGDGAGFAHHLGYDRWPLARDLGGINGSGLRDSLGGLGLPVTAFYNGDGRLVHVSQGALSEEALRSGLRDYLGPPGRPAAAQRLLRGQPTRWRRQQLVAVYPRPHGFGAHSRSPANWRTDKATDSERHDAAQLPDLDGKLHRRPPAR
jgi:thiol-disulfide isomerase/thioredoxin